MTAEKNGALFVDVKAFPRSGRQAVEREGDLLKVRLKSAPVDGAANAEIVGIFAKLFRVPKSAVSIVRGETSRQKTVKIEGVAEADLRAALDEE